SQMHDAVLHVRPAECAVLEPLGEQTNARAIPEDQLHTIGPLGAEHIDGAGERIGRHPLAHQSGQAFGALAEVDRLGRHHHPDRSGRTDHAPVFNARSTAVTVLVSAPRPTRTVTPSISTSMIPQTRSPRRGRLRSRWRTARFGSCASTTAGTNRGAAAAGSRACR